MSRWIRVRIDVLGGIFAATLAAYLFYGREAPTASNTGFQLNLAVTFTAMLLWWYVQHFSIYCTPWWYTDTDY